MYRLSRYLFFTSFLTRPQGGSIQGHRGGEGNPRYLDDLEAARPLTSSFPRLRT